MAGFWGGRRAACGRLVTALALAVVLVSAPVPGHAGGAGDGSGLRASTVTIGHSVRGRPIRAMERAGAGNVTRTAVVIGQVHGDETAGLRVVAALARAQVPAGLRLLLIPTGNPDGYAAHRRTNARGVDLNRNFPTEWRRTGRGATYSGPRMASEPETRALQRFLSETSPAAVVILHQPLYGVDTSVPRALPLARSISAETGLPLKSFRCSSTCHGTLTGWFAAHGAGSAVTLELGRGASPSTVSRVAAGVLRAVATS